MALISLLLLFISFAPSYQNQNEFIKQFEYHIDHSCHLDFKKDPINGRVFKDQLQDHFDALNSKTWNHSYFVHEPSDPSHASDIPIFIFGGEGPTGGDNRQIRDLFVSNSTVFTLAHRYYQPGEYSNPTRKFNHKTDSRLLSSQQALADAAFFIKRVVMGEFKFKKPPIIYGCSYSGSLAAWFRLKYPHLSFGAISMSSPIFALDDYHQFLDVTEKVLYS